MDQNLKKATDLRIDRVCQALERNNMTAVHVTSKEQLFALLEEYIKGYETAGFGGSMTLGELGVMDWLRSGKIQLFDRADAKTPEENHAIMRRALTADIFFMSSNAVTEDGRLYNVDGNGSRVAPLIYGPKSVVVIVGANKLVRDLDEADKRVKAIAAPANNLRLATGNPCTKLGSCQDCRNPHRICCHTVITGFQGEAMKGRIKVLILDGNYGY